MFGRPDSMSSRASMAKEETKSPGFMARIRGVANNIKSAVQNVLSPGQKELNEQPAEQRQVDIGRTAFHFGEGVQAAIRKNELHVVTGTQTHRYPLRADGSISEETKRALERKGLTVKIDCATDLASKAISIASREKASGQGSVATSEKNGVVSLRYLPSSLSPATQPNMALITLNNSPDSPVLRFPVQYVEGQGWIAQIKSDAVPGSVERFLYEQGFVRKNGHPVPQVFRMEFVHVKSDEASRDNGLHITSLAHQTRQANGPQPVEYPEYTDAFAYAVHIQKRRLASPVIKKPSEVTDPGQVLRAKRQSILEQWKTRHVHLLDAQEQDYLQKQLQLHRGKYMQEFLELFAKSGAFVWVKLSTWLTENLSLMSVSEIAALQELDRMLRSQEAGRLFPMSDDMLLDSALPELDAAYHRSKDPSTIANSTSGTMFVSEFYQVMRAVSETEMTESQKVRNYFAHMTQLFKARKIVEERLLGENISIEERIENKIRIETVFQEKKALIAPPPTRSTFIQFQKQVAKDFPMIEHMDGAMEILKQTSSLYQNLYGERSSLYQVASTMRLDKEALSFIAAAFDNDLQELPEVCPDDGTLPMRTFCLTLARQCQVQLLQVTAGTRQLEEMLAKQDKQANKELSSIEKEYIQTPLLYFQTEQAAGIFTREKDPLQSMSTWEGSLKRCLTLGGCGFPDIEDLAVKQLHALMKRGGNIIYSSRRGIMTEGDRFAILQDLYDNFLVLKRGEPIILCFYLEVYLGVLMHEEDQTIFGTMQSILLQLIQYLPASWAQKKEDLLELYDMLLDRQVLHDEGTVLATNPSGESLESLLQNAEFYKTE